MKAAQRVRTYFLLSAMILAPSPADLIAATASEATPSADQKRSANRDGQHDFDFEFGTWKAHIKRLQQPLSGSKTWVELEGTSVVRPVWGGRANLGELRVSNDTTNLQGLSLRLYDPGSGQWNIHWANSKDGQLGPAMIGQFTNGRGEFYNQEMFEGISVYVRFIFSDITADSFRLEQAFSADGGKTWEPNWIATFTRQAG